MGVGQKKHMLTLSEWHILAIIRRQEDDEELGGGEIGSRFTDLFSYRRPRATHTAQVLSRLYYMNLVQRWYGVDRDGNTRVRANYIITAAGEEAYVQMTEHVLCVLEI